ncbi:MAG: c-type cytochrome [Gammaproteobacteria bacterium]|nr:c-type cytochrome [Gammaproteobacteria bacterium]
MSQGSKGASKLMIAVWLIVMIFIAAMYFSSSSDDTAEATTDSATLERIEPVGEVSVESAVASTGGVERSGADLYSRCQGCHGSGAMGAPKFGSLADWAPRIERGIDDVLQVAIAGLGAMPPKGGCSDCSDNELKSVIQYMMDSAK